MCRDLSSKFGLGAGQVVGAPAGHLDRRIGRRHLLHQSDEAIQHGLRLPAARAHRALGHNASLGIVGVRRLAPAQGEAVGLGAFHDVGNGLGRFAQGDGQKAARHGVEGAAVTQLLGIEDAPHDAHHLCRGRPDGLVDQDPAVHRPASPPTCHGPAPRSGHRPPRGRGAPGGSAGDDRSRPPDRRSGRRRMPSAACGAG